MAELTDIKQDFLLEGYYRNTRLIMKRHFAFVAKLTTDRLMIALTTTQNWATAQIVVKNAFPSEFKGTGLYETTSTLLYRRALLNIRAYTGSHTSPCKFFSNIRVKVLENSVDPTRLQGVGPTCSLTPSTWTRTGVHIFSNFLYRDLFGLEAAKELM